MPSVNPIIQVRVDPEIKAAAARTAAGIGIPLSTLINAFVTRLAWEGKVPFELKAPDIPNAETIAAMMESERIAHDPAARGWTDVDAMMKELLSDA